MKSLFNRLRKSNYKSDDFGRGKTKTSKARHKRWLKRKAKRMLAKNLN